MMIFAAVIMIWVVAALLAALVIGRLAADRSSAQVWRTDQPEPQIPAQRAPSRMPERTRRS